MKKFIVGRSSRANVVLSNNTVSSEHLEITLAGADATGEDYRVALRDLNSTNGSFIYRNGKAERFTLTSATQDDVLKLGDEQCSVRRLLNEACRETSAKPATKTSAARDQEQDTVSVYIRNASGSFDRRG